MSNRLKREVILTSDGSTTLFLPEWNESYHSKHGAVLEAYHVFIKNGLNEFKNKPISILEMGFGTGLNCFITFLESKKHNQIINYVGVEGYPIPLEITQTLNYPEMIDVSESEVFKKTHLMEWDEKHQISTLFSLTKRQQFFNSINDVEAYDLIYFDVFGYRVQPELWSEEMFAIMYRALKPEGLLVTYACRTVIKQAMINAGFTVEKLKGAPGKREMLRAIKKCK